MKLASRVTLALTTVTAGVLVASFAVVLVLVSRDELRDLDRSLYLQAQASADRALLRSNEHPRISEGDAHVPERISSITRYVVIYDNEGRAYSFSSSFFGKPPALTSLGVGLTPPFPGETLDLTIHGAALRGVLIPLGDQGHRMLFAVSRKTIDDDLQFLWRLMAGIFVAAVGLTSILARWISARISRDVEAIAAVARAVAGGNLGARVGTSAQGTTETLSLGEDVDRMVHQLGAAIDTQRTFVSHAAHELRSPLSTIRGELQLALRRERSATEYRQAIEETLTDVQALSALAEQLLVLARVQAAPTFAKPDELASIEDVVGDTLHAVRGTARELGVRVTLEPSADATPLVVHGVRNELGRALRNLVDNAVNHSQPGGQVTISIEVVGRRIIVSVVDQGPGVASQDVPYLFEPFFRASKDQASERPGAGLGLPIARDIARAHGGDLRFATDQTAGCTFVLELPLARAEA